MAISGEFSWPYLGNSRGHIWGILVAAYGEFIMSAVNQMLRMLDSPNSTTCPLS